MHRDLLQALSPKKPLDNSDFLCNGMKKEDCKKLIDQLVDVWIENKSTGDLVFVYYFNEGGIRAFDIDSSLKYPKKIKADTE